jgi:hypothetical protein
MDFGNCDRQLDTQQILGSTTKTIAARPRRRTELEELKSSKPRWFATVEKIKEADGQVSGGKWIIVEDVTTTRLIGEIADDRFVPRDGIVETPERRACADEFLKCMRFTGMDLTPGKNEGCRIELFRNNCESTT